MVMRTCPFWVSKTKNIESETKQQKPKSEGMASNIAEIINAVHGVHCHQCYDLSISYHQCHKVTKSLNRYPCICLYLCVCAIVHAFVFYHRL